MKTYLLAATALAAATIATPAAARDHTAYFGLEIGALWAQDSHVRFPGFTGDGSAAFDVDHKLGADGDLIAGYDFGMIRAELEGAHKWAKHNTYSDGIDSIDAAGHSRAYSIMGNLLLDVGKDDTVNFYAGGGVGIAWVRQRFAESSSPGGFTISDSGLAWQGIAGIRAPVFVHFDIGLKYRYFSAGKIKDDIGSQTVTSRFRSHSLLASLIYNFGAPEPPPPPPPVVEPPPPPPPPATQTCADGSVILATDACPLPPPPPPPPPPEPERG